MLRLDYWVSMAAEAERCAKLEERLLHVGSSEEECYAQVAGGDGVASLAEEDA